MSTPFKQKKAKLTSNWQFYVISAQKYFNISRMRKNPKLGNADADRDGVPVKALAILTVFDNRSAQNDTVD